MPKTIGHSCKRRRFLFFFLQKKNYFFLQNTPHASLNLSLSAIAGMNFGLKFLVISIPRQISGSDYTSCRPLLINDRE